MSVLSGVDPRHVSNLSCVEWLFSFASRPIKPGQYGGGNKFVTFLWNKRIWKCVTLSSTVFRFFGESLSLQPSEQFLFCLPVGHSALHEGKDQFIHQLIQLREPPCDFLLVHSRWDWQIPIWSGYCTLVLREHLTAMRQFRVISVKNSLQHVCDLL